MARRRPERKLRADEEKDETIVNKRKRNTAAAKRSRAKKAQEVKDLTARVKALEEEMALNGGKAVDEGEAPKEAEAEEGGAAQEADADE